MPSDSKEQTEDKSYVLGSFENTKKLDQLKKIEEDVEVYTSTLRSIISGETPTIKEFEDVSDSVVNKIENLNISGKDSLFRVEIEKKSSGDYMKTDVDKNLVFFPPLKGEIVDSYSLEKNHFGGGGILFWENSSSKKSILGGGITNTLKNTGHNIR